MRYNSLDMSDWAVLIVYHLLTKVIPLLIVFVIVWKFVGTGPVYTLSEGTMNATSAKMSHKGWHWKTWEGWIPVGVNNEGGLDKWYFTATNEIVANCVKDNDKVRLSYTDNVLMPFRFGSGHQVYKCEVRK